MKRAFDLALAGVGLLASMPLWAAVAAAVKLEDGGPVFFSQERVGLNGRVFRAFKFRSMIPDAEAKTGPVQAAAHDPRVTRVGRFLRRYKLDELPQLLNVLAGEMSVVGPRPEVSRYVAMFPERFARVLETRPGLTDYAALEYLDEEAVLAASADPEHAYVDQVLPAKLDLYDRYLAEQSLATDLRLIARTFFAILKRSDG